ncbi:MAG: adenine phosphoribosyltransferase [Rhodanobacter sp.]
MQEFAELIRDVPDFPRRGVMFRDVSPLLASADAFACCIEALAAPWRDRDVQVVGAVEARGFIFGAALAQRLGVGFVPLRKPGKLPPPVQSVDYQLEYGEDRLEIRDDVLQPAQRVLLVDDVLATGGTLCAAAELVAGAGGMLLGAAVVIELDALGGRSRWAERGPLHSLLRY